MTNEAERKRTAYLSCVGEQDPISPKTKAQGSLLTCWEYLRREEGITFDAVYVVPTSREANPERNTQQGGEACLDAIEAEGQENLALVPLMVRNPANLKELYPVMKATLGAIREKELEESGGRPFTIHINVSSGTPQMKQLLPFLASIGFWEPAEVFLWQVYDPRTDASERVRPAPELDLLEVERTILQVKELLRRHHYGAIVEETKRLATNPDLDTDRLKILWRICRILDISDRQWDYHWTAHESEKLRNETGQPHLRDWLAEVEKALSRLSRGDLDELARERYFSLLRREAIGAWPQMVIEGSNVCELVCRHIFSRGKGATSESFRAMIERLRDDPQWKKKQISLRGEGHPFLGRVDALRARRNDALHGTRIIQKEVAAEAREVARAMLLEGTNFTERDLDEAPLAPRTVTRMIETLIDAIEESLWC